MPNVPIELDAEELRFLLKLLDGAILRTPTSPQRNKLTIISMKLKRAHLEMHDDDGYDTYPDE